MAANLKWKSYRCSLRHGHISAGLSSGLLRILSLGAFDFFSMFWGAVEEVRGCKDKGLDRHVSSNPLFSIPFSSRNSQPWVGSGEGDPNPGQPPSAPTSSSERPQGIQKGGPGTFSPTSCPSSMLLSDGLGKPLVWAASSWLSERASEGLLTAVRHTSRAWRSPRPHRTQDVNQCELCLRQQP